MFKKILLMVILAISVVGCELLSPKEWREYHERKAERGVRCYKDSGGYYTICDME